MMTEQIQYPKVYELTTAESINYDRIRAQAFIFVVYPVTFFHTKTQCINFCYFSFYTMYIDPQPSS